MDVFVGGNGSVVVDLLFPALEVIRDPFDECVWEV